MAQIVWTDNHGQWETKYKGVRIFKSYGLLVVDLLDSSNLPTGKDRAFKDWAEVTEFIDQTGAKA